MEMKTYLDLLKILPKTNCKECGEASCLLFALKVFSGQTSLEKCPYLDQDLLPQRTSLKGLSFNQTLENLKILREKFQSLDDFIERAQDLGCELESQRRGVLLPYLDWLIRIEVNQEGHPTQLINLSGETLDPRDEILLCNYFIFNGKEPLTMDFVGLESFPHSLSKVKTLKIYGEDPLVELFTQNQPKLRSILQRFRVKDFQEDTHGFSFLVSILPKVILKVVYWEGDPEDGLPPGGKVLYDRVALNYLDLECLVFSAERFAERLRWLIQGSI